MKTAIFVLATLGVVFFAGDLPVTAKEIPGNNVQAAEEASPAKVLPSLSLGDRDKNTPEVASSDAVPAYDIPLSAAAEGGDINLNGIPNEIADAVLYAKYFVYGLEVFRVDQATQVMETDVNADGLPLSVSDLVYQLHIIE